LIPLLFLVGLGLLSRRDRCQPSSSGLNGTGGYATVDTCPHCEQEIRTARESGAITDVERQFGHTKLAMRPSVK
jgi:hypothetical protein